jgi:hypothetical protein
MDVRIRVCSAQEVYLSTAMISPMKFGCEIASICCQWIIRLEIIVE